MAGRIGIGDRDPSPSIYPGAKHDDDDEDDGGVARSARAPCYRNPLRFPKSSWQNAAMFQRSCKTYTHLDLLVSLLTGDVLRAAC